MMSAKITTIINLVIVWGGVGVVGHTHGLVALTEPVLCVFKVQL